MTESNLLRSLGQVSSDQVGEVFRDYPRGSVRQMIVYAMADAVSELCGRKYDPADTDHYRADSTPGRVLHKGRRTVDAKVTTWTHQFRELAGRLPNPCPHSTWRLHIAPCGQSAWDCVAFCATVSSEVSLQLRRETFLTDGSENQKHSTRPLHGRSASGPS